ncbi:MAG: aldehyde ferredoxin oxidoreductase N-terminal domain-containing protein [Desulfobacteraceae bacterium]
MKGFFGKILKIDLSSGNSEVETIPDAVYQRSLGGKGLAAYLLLRDNPPGVDPLGAENRLIFATGPAAGSPVWGSCRHGVFTKSPQTGFFSESYAGGTAAEPMSATGYDAVVLSGTSKNPVWIEVGNESVEIHDASELWGLDTYEAEDAVKDWIRNHRPSAGRPGTLVIGPAGENRVVFSVIENDRW